MYVIRVHQRDNVAVALMDLAAGETITLPWGGELKVTEQIPASHKFALVDLEVDQGIWRYGQPIGAASQKISKGCWVHTHNLKAPEGISPPGPEALGGGGGQVLHGPHSFPGYARVNGPSGIRNHLLVLPTVACANSVVRAIGHDVPEAIPLEHGHGCGRGGEDLQRTLRVLKGCCVHPNVGAVLLIGLGCEAIRIVSPGEALAQEIASSGRLVQYLEIQKSGGSRRTTEKGIQLARRLLNKISSQKRGPQPIGDLMVGLQCGGSDALSGVTANPTVGMVSDWIVAQGGTVLLAETTEMIGTAHLLRGRAANANVAEEIQSMISKNEALIIRMLGEQAHLAVAPGNMDGGLSSIMEKSMGCIAKGGTTAIEEVVPYGKKPGRRGLVLMDTPGYDVESLGGLVGAGCQVILFTTGRGTPVGAPLAPTIKVASNSRLWRLMEEDLDINAGEITDNDRSIEEMGQILLNCLAEVLCGRLTRAEENRQQVMGISMTMEAG
jgi:altronate dehydratase large subunit